MPVPSGTIASSGRGSARIRPFTTSLSVPSPPTATTSEAPPLAACSASSIRWPGCSERNASPSSPSVAARLARSGHRLPVTPLSDAGLTRNTVSSGGAERTGRSRSGRRRKRRLGGGDGGEADTGHPVDRGTELVVADPRELALDDDVADRQQAARIDAAQRAEREQDRRLHLDSEDAALRPAPVLARVGVVEDVARDDRPDVHRLVQLLRRVHGGVDELEARRRAVRLLHVRVRRPVLGDRADRDDHVAEPVMRLQPAAGPDAENLLAAEHDELLDHDRRRGTAHARRLHRDRLAVPRATEAEHAALRVRLHDVVEVGLGDVLRPQRIAGHEHRLGIVAGLGADVDRHRATLTRTGEWDDRDVQAVTQTLDQILAFCTREPIERVFLEDIARRGLGRFSALADGGELVALCHVGANVVPSGSRCGVFADAAVRGAPRMIIGEERAVGELWAEAAANLPRPRDDRPGQPVYVLDEPPDPGGTGLRRAQLEDLDLLVPACAAAHREEIGIDPLRRDPDGFRWRTRAQIEEGRSWSWVEDDVIRFKAEASAWTPSAVRRQQLWVGPSARNGGDGRRGLRDLCGLRLGRV